MEFFIRPRSVSQPFPADDAAYQPQSLDTVRPTATGTSTNQTKISPL